jgi:chromosome segregation ATPase
MGLKNFVLEPGALTEVTGPNGSGKSSIASAISSMTEGTAHDATLLRNGELEGRVVIEFDSGAIVAQKTITKDGSKLSVKVDGKASKTPAATIKELLNKASVNPISFFYADKAERKRILLKALPVQADAEKLREISGLDCSHYSGTAWDIIASIRDTIYKSRTSTNTVAKEKRNTAHQMRQALPDDLDLEPVDISELQAKSDALDSEKDAKIKAIDDKMQEFIAIASKDIDNVESNFQGIFKAQEDAILDLENRLRVLRDSLSTSKTELKDAKQAINSALEEKQTRANNKKSEHLTAWKLAKEEVNAKIKSIQKGAENAGRVKQALETIEKMTQEAIALESDSQHLTGAIEELDKYKTSLLDNLPIKGLEVSGDDILHHGVTWDRLNEAKRMELAFEIALLQCGKVPFIFVDGAERLDGKNMEVFKERVKQSGVQCLMLPVNHDLEAEGLTTRDLS